MLLLILALILALILSAFFTAAELSVFSVSPHRINQLIDDGRRGSAALSELRARPGRAVVLLRLGDGVADVVAGATGAYIAYLKWNLLGALIALPVLGVFILVIGELAPLTIALNRGISVALLVAPPLRLLTRALGPLLGAIEKVAGVIPERSLDLMASFTGSEVREMSVINASNGPIEEHERQLIQRAFQLDETKAWNIMTPRVDIFAIEDSRTLAGIALELGTIRYSRVPVYDETIDNITGVLYIRDAYQALISGMRDVPLRELAREPLIVPGSISVTRLLREFQTRRIHLAIVMDEYGGTDGIVTLEDVLEELVGEIVDEKDAPEEMMTRVSKNEIVALGDVDLREINHFFNTAFPQLEHRSLNGYLLEELGRVPETGEVLERDGVIIEVLEASDTQLLRARLRRAEKKQPQIEKA
ncbi:MAG TPA: hemolysin family protein [Longimicrobiales bacterium]